eukprot:TRINITY_DN50370_c0_g1_i1.p1 TRINITY_DN50370_c0_g1~~TRINITY_DN50370_c0_g1_i1.p1  ORF type:complete len:205 (+),score=53.40 TRINITY_DN50370_c0_g1_i1:217-831(+)
MMPQQMMMHGGYGPPRGMPPHMMGMGGPMPMAKGGMRFMGGPNNMPPASNYHAPQKAENPEYQSLAPGQAAVYRGFKSGPISEKGQRLMNKYEEVMRRPQGYFPDVYSFSRAQKYAQTGSPTAGGGKGGPPPPMGPPQGMGGKPACHFFKSPQGCRNGESCKFSHDPHAKPAFKAGGPPKPHSIKVKCRNLPNCQFGEKCRFQH